MDNKNITKVYLLNVPLENDYKNTLYFTSKESQQEYFQSAKVKEYTNFSYQRKDSFIRVPDHFDNLQNVNYVMYQNRAYSNKWFYAFVTDIKYVDDGRTDLIIETDYIQTWLFDYNVKASFVEREHVSDDTIGLHTIPENVELGDYIVNKRTDSQNLVSASEIIVATTLDLTKKESGKYKGAVGCYSGGVYSGIKYYHFINDGSLNTLLKDVAEAGQSDGIVAIFMGNSDFYETKEIEGKTFSEIKESLGTYEKEFGYTVFPSGGTAYNVTTPEKPTKIDNYTPINKKLLTYPYCFLYASNNNGGSGIYKYERFSGDKTEFKFYGCITPGMSIRFVPLNYNNQEINNDEGINCGKLPICAWTTDVYTNWLTQNALNIGVGVAGSIGQIVGGVVASGSGAGALIGAGQIYGGLLGVANSIGQIHQYSLTPPQAEGNINSGDVTTSMGFNKISLFEKSIKSEYAKIIDEYFNMFGYKVNRVKVPNKAHRSRYWYTKTIDVNIDGAIPMKDIQVIKDCYNKGITFWRNASEIQNYSLSNLIV